MSDYSVTMEKELDIDVSEAFDELDGEAKLDFLVEKFDELDGDDQELAVDMMLDKMYEWRVKDVLNNGICGKLSAKNQDDVLEDIVDSLSSEQIAKLKDIVDGLYHG